MNNCYGAFALLFVIISLSLLTVADCEIATWHEEANMRHPGYPNDTNYYKMRRSKTCKTTQLCAKKSCKTSDCRAKVGRDGSVNCKPGKDCSWRSNCNASWTKTSDYGSKKLGKMYYFDQPLIDNSSTRCEEELGSWETWPRLTDNGGCKFEKDTMWVGDTLKLSCPNTVTSTNPSSPYVDVLTSAYNITKPSVQRNGDIYAPSGPLTFTTTFQPMSSYNAGNQVIPKINVYQTVSSCYYPSNPTTSKGEYNVQLPSNSNESKIVKIFPTGCKDTKSGLVATSFKISPNPHADGQLVFDAVTGSLGGTFNRPMNATEFTITPNNGKDGTSFKIKFQVIAYGGPIGYSSCDAGIMTVGSPLTCSVSAPTSSSLTDGRASIFNTRKVSILDQAFVAVRFEINPPMSNGLQFNTSTGAVTGTPQHYTSPEVYSITPYSAANIAGSVFTFTSQFGSGCSYNNGKPASFDTDTAVSFPVSNCIVTSTTTFSMSAIQDGLTIDSSNGKISGTVSQPFSAAYTVTICDNSGCFANTVFQVEALYPLVKNCVYSQAVNSILTVRNMTSTDFSLACASNKGATTYSISPPIDESKTALRFNNSTGKLFGTFEQSESQVAYTITPNNGREGTAFPIQFAVEIRVPTGCTYADSDVLIGLNETKTFTVSGCTGDAPTSFSISAGFMSPFNKTSGAIVVTPTAATYNVWYVTAANEWGNSKPIPLIIKAGVPVEGCQYSQSNVVTTGQWLAQDQAIQVKGCTNSETIKEFTIFPSLPKGLIFDSKTGAIYGATEQEPGGATSFWVRPYNSAGPWDSTVVDIAVQEPTDLDYKLYKYRNEIITSCVALALLLAFVVYYWKQRVTPDKNIIEIQKEHDETQQENQEGRMTINPLYSMQV